MTGGVHAATGLASAKDEKQASTGAQDRPHTKRLRMLRDWWLLPGDVLGVVLERRLASSGALAGSVPAQGPQLLEVDVAAAEDADDFRPRRRVDQAVQQCGHRRSGSTLHDDFAVVHRPEQGVEDRPVA